MATATQTDRSSVPTPLFAVVGATDLAVERVRAVVAGMPSVQAQFEARMNAVQADVEKRVGEFDPRTIGETITARAQELPTKAAARALEVASISQARYEELAVRGKTLLDTIRAQASTRQLINQAGSTVSRGKAAVTTARKAADDTYVAILGTLGVGRAEVEDVVVTSRTTAKTAAKTAANRTTTAAKRTTTAAKRTSTTARKGAAATKSATKGARTSATKTVSAASKAASDAANKVGE
jgi:hypothetical protein